MTTITRGVTEHIQGRRQNSKIVRRGFDVGFHEVAIKITGLAMRQLENFRVKNDLQTICALVSRLNIFSFWCVACCFSAREKKTREEKFFEMATGERSRVFILGTIRATETETKTQATDSDLAILVQGQFVFSAFALPQ